VFWRRRRKEDSLSLYEQAALATGVQKTREGVFGKISGLFHQAVIDEDTWDQLLELLIASDMGPALAMRLVDRARELIESEELRTPVEAETALRKQLVESLGSADFERLEDLQGRVVVHLVGVNGAGKTTTSAKIANYVQQLDMSCVLVAADTFRAAAIDQLKVWGRRVGVDVIATQPNSDPGAVVFDAVQAANRREIDLVIVDTAGRLHTKFNLMEELRKIKRVAAKADPEVKQVVLCVLDATTGQNGLQQAKSFLDAVEVDGVVLTKLDGTSKGGVVFAIFEQLRIPIWYVGLGEKPADFAPFDHLAFVNALFDDVSPAVAA
jgi:fused signal recognition particle receptor